MGRMNGTSALCKWDYLKHEGVRTVQTVMFILSVSQKNALCVSLRPNGSLGALI